MDLEGVLVRNGLVNNTEGYLAQKYRLTAIANGFLLEPDEKTDDKSKPKSKMCTNNPCEAMSHCMSLTEDSPSISEDTGLSKGAVDGVTRYSFNDPDIF